MDPALARAIIQTRRAVAFARRDLGLETAAVAAAVDEACQGLLRGDRAWPPDLGGFAGQANEPLADSLERLVGRGAQGTGLAASGFLSVGAHLATIVAIRKESLPGIYRLEAALQARAVIAPFRDALGRVERARRRLSTAAESLREVAFSAPPADPRFPTPEQQLASRTLGYLNEGERLQLKATEALPPGGTIDAALEVGAALRGVAVVVASIAGSLDGREGWPATLDSLQEARLTASIAVAEDARIASLAAFGIEPAETPWAALGSALLASARAVSEGCGALAAP